MLTDDAGAVVGRAFYDAYGGVISNTIPLTLTSRLYEGRPFDAATDLVYHGGGRYYPSTSSGQATRNWANISSQTLLVVRHCCPRPTTDMATREAMSQVAMPVSRESFRSQRLSA
jgi:hypothetical protein